MSSVVTYVGTISTVGEYYSITIYKVETQYYDVDILKLEFLSG